MTRIYSVREVTGAIKDVLETEFPFLWVRGQVANLSRPGSGHIYFSLKDEEAVLHAVWFRSSQGVGAGGVHPLTGEVADPGPGLAASLSNGQEVLCGGRLTVYPPRGACQLVVELVQDIGRGRLWLEFEALKRKLSAEGFFDLSRKRALPSNPAKVAVVTAPTGAAIRDFLRLAQERGWGCAIRIYPALVQGDDAPASIVAAMETVRLHGWAEVVALIRGGGSIEDLWAFNTEPVARAVFECGVPVLAGIGHEVDVTIADMTADVRAATPSHAAQLLWPERTALAQRIDGLEKRLFRAGKVHLARLERDLGGLERALAWRAPDSRLIGIEERLLDAVGRIRRAWDVLLERREAAVQRASTGLGHAFGPAALDVRRRQLETAIRHLAAAAGTWMRDWETSLERAALRLEGVDPERPLRQGYSLVRIARTGRFLRSVHEAVEGDTLEVQLRDGCVEATVTDVREGEP